MNHAVEQIVGRERREHVSQLDSSGDDGMNSRRRVNSNVGQLLYLSAMKPQHAKRIAGILPSLLVSLVHFRLSLLVAPHANVVFQRWFDTGEVATGADAVVASVDRFLSLPIPAIFFAAHPVYRLARGWWIATAVNSVIWGLAVYACYVLSIWVLNKYVRRLPI